MIKSTTAPLVAGLFAIAVIFGSTAAFAQSGSGGTEINEKGFAVPSEAQLEMNEKGVKAIVDGDFDKAARLFQASIDLGKLNITYLNLGRALQKAGRCREAKQAYLNVKKKETPKVQNPPPFEISSRAEQYLAELERTCPGEVEVTCEPDDLAEDVQLFINTRGPKECNDDPFEVPPGEVVVKGVLGEQTLEKVATVSPVELASVTLTFERPTKPPVAEKPESETDDGKDQTDDPESDPDAKNSDEPEVAQADTDANSTTERPPPTGTDVELEQPVKTDEAESGGGGGWWLAAGMGVIGGGLYFDVIHKTASNGELDGVDFIPPGAYLLGGIAVIYGISNL
jgi:hypothetical protein